MLTKDDELWFVAHKAFDLWYNNPETMNNYQEWDDPPNILGDTSIISEYLNKHIEPDFYIGKHQT